MNYILAVFKSRFSTLNFASMLRANNIPVAIINTPQSIGRVCGISVKFLSDYFSKVQTLLSSARVTNFEGFYSVTERNGKINLFKL
jgi:ribosomal protein L7Ae-like RNA K-turn-binding protein